MQSQPTRNSRRILMLAIQLFLMSNLLLLCPDTALAEMSVLASLPMDMETCFGCVAVNPVTNRIYLTGDTRGRVPDNQPYSWLTVIDGTTNTVQYVDLKALTLPVWDPLYFGEQPFGDIPQGLAVNPETNRIYIMGRYTLLILDGTTNSYVDWIEIPQESAHNPHTFFANTGIAVNPVTNRIYIQQGGPPDGSGLALLTVVDGVTHSIVAQFATGIHGTVTFEGGTNIRQWGVPMAVNSSTNRVYVAGGAIQDGEFGPAFVATVDGNSNSLLTTLEIPFFGTPGQIMGMGFNSTYDRIYIVGNDPWGNSVMTVVDATTGNVLDDEFFWEPSPSRAVAVNPTTNRIFNANGPACCAGSGHITVIDGATGAILQVIPTAGTGFGGMAVNPETNRIYFTGPFPGTNFYVVGEPGNSTTTGTDIAVQPVDTTTGGTPLATITFSSVSQEGDTTLVSSSSGPNPPSGFKIGDPAVFYDISTTASFGGAIDLCFIWTEGQFDNESNIALFHHENGVWTNVTTSLDTTTNKVCGQTFSLSPFALFETSYTFTGFFAPVDNPPVRNVSKAGSAVPVKFSLGGNRGLSIFSQGYPASQAVGCDSSAPLSDIEETVTAGQSSLSYDALFDRYTYVWKTQKAWANSCRRLVLRFIDGTTRTADFTFSK